MIKNVIFDLGRVIYNFWPQNYLTELGYSEEQISLLMGRIITSELWLEYDRGVHSRAGLIEKLTENFPDMADDFKRILNDDFVDKVITVMPPNLDFFYEVKNRGFKVYILSNFFKDGFEHCRKRDAFLSGADGMVISAYEGLVKPDPAIYQLLLDRYGLVPQECLFIDDMKHNVEAAEALGIRTIHFTSLEDCKRQFEELVK